VHNPLLVGLHRILDFYFLRIEFTFYINVPMIVLYSSRQACRRYYYLVICMIVSCVCVQFKGNNRNRKIPIFEFSKRRRNCLLINENGKHRKEEGRMEKLNMIYDISQHHQLHQSLGIILDNTALPDLSGIFKRNRYCS
jgi:hypothetical protein